MKRIVLLAVILCCSISLYSQDKTITKTGYNFGPLPIVAFDADKGLQYGGLVQIYNFGDGSNYPNYNSKFTAEASFFTKGSNLFQITYDNKTLIHGVRLSSSVYASVDKAMDFLGFNGYESYYDYERIAIGKQNKVNQNPYQFDYSPFYKMARTNVIAKIDFTGDITKHLKWEAGYHFSYFKIGAIDRDSINKGKKEYDVYQEAETLYEQFVKWGLISNQEANGGLTSSIRLGIQYDTRDKEGAPTSGIWAEAHISAAPKWLGTSIPFARYSATFRQYLPIIENNTLTFAYRLNYEGTIGSNAPFYVLPYITCMGEGADRDGMGGYRTVRGITRGRVVGLDMFTYIAELRWRFVNFRLFNQNISLGLSAFSDGSMVTKARNMNVSTNNLDYANYMSKGLSKDKLHITIGGGFRFIMNENFIIAAEYGLPISYLNKNSALYGQDGTGAFYINTGYLF